MSRSKTPAAPHPVRREKPEDSILARLSKEDRAKLAMDSWEPSLLRQLMTAHNALGKNNKN
jgi:hypothetical protein